MVENMNDGVPMDEFADEELSDLFSAFDGIGASDALKAKTLGAIAALPTAGAGAATARVAVDQQAAADAAGSARASAGGKAATTGKAAKAARGPFRALRIASIAACVSVAIVGGVAYGMPTSHVVLSQGEASVELNVNRFGVVVAASSDDDAGRAIVDAGGLVNAPYEDAFVRIASAMGDSSSISVVVESGDPAQRELLENDGASLFAGLAEEQANEKDDKSVESLQSGAEQGDGESGDGQVEPQQPEGEAGVSQLDEPAEPSAQEDGYQQYYSNAQDDQGSATTPSDNASSSPKRRASKSADWGSALAAGEELGNPHSNPEAEGVSEYAIVEEPIGSGELSRPELPIGFGATLERSEALYDWATWDPSANDSSSWGSWNPGNGGGSWSWGTWGSGDAGGSWNWGSWGSGNSGGTGGSWNWGQWGIGHDSDSDDTLFSGESSDA